MAVRGRPRLDEEAVADRVICRLPAAEKQQLKEIARSQSVRDSDVIREAIRQYLSRLPEEISA
jgi:CHAD domain-containing protein